MGVPRDSIGVPRNFRDIVILKKLLKQFHSILTLRKEQERNVQELYQIYFPENLLAYNQRVE
jgi:dynactin complex subunit